MQKFNTKLSLMIGLFVFCTIFVQSANAMETLINQVMGNTIKTVVSTLVTIANKLMKNPNIGTNIVLIGAAILAGTINGIILGGLGAIAMCGSSVLFPIINRLGNAVIESATFKNLYNRFMDKLPELIAELAKKVMGLTAQITTGFIKQLPIVHLIPDTIHAVDTVVSHIPIIGGLFKKRKPLLF